PLGPAVESPDRSVSASLSSTVAPRAGNELPVSAGAGSRDLGRASVAGTIFTDGFAAGTPSLEPGTFKRSTFHVAETIHYNLGMGALKDGAQATFTSHDQAYADGRAGIVTFGDTTALARRTGEFWQAVGWQRVTLLDSVDFG